MNNIPPVSKVLTDMNIPHRVFRHSGPVKSLEQAALERGQHPEQVVRSILFRITEGEYVMVLIAGPQQIPWKSLRQYIGKSRITMASKEEVLEVTGYELGAVSPFGLPTKMRILVDESVLTQEEVSLGSGVRGTAIFIHTKDLMNALGEVEIANFGKR